jgi:hypothetical protein
VSERNWYCIDQAQKGIGPLLLRAGSGQLDPVFVGYQADDGRWFVGDQRVHPTHYCEIPPFNADDVGAAA